MGSGTLSASNSIAVVAVIAVTDDLFRWTATDHLGNVEEHLYKGRATLPEAYQECGAGVRPLAVQLRRHGDELKCTVLCASRTGPKRVPVSVASGLVLCQHGVRSTFVGSQQGIRL